MKQKYIDILGIIIFGYAALATINKLERYGWMFVNKKIKINAEILSFNNQEGGGYEWSLITIKYYYNSKEYKPSAFTVEGHLTNDQSHIIAFINKNNPIQVCTKNNLGGFFLMFFFQFSL
ncbi:MAG: hypothetical protein Q8K70_10645 [Bacteroidota bacterium]|nr:hypothetical protein [Bacteroidota bacterium]